MCDERSKLRYDQVTRNQAAIDRALAAPYSAFLRNQDLFLNAMRAAAAELDVDEGSAVQADLSPEQAWFSQWLAAVSEWAPSADQAQDLLNGIAYLLALLAFAITMASPDTNVDELLAATSLLFGAGAYVIRFVNRRG